MSTNEFSLSYAPLYLVILAIHAGYATYLIRSGKDPLKEGGVENPKLIVLLLLLINGVSIIAPFTPSRGAFFAHLGFRVIMFVDELRRLPRAKHRWVFAIDHLAWMGLLGLQNGR